MLEGEEHQVKTIVFKHICGKIKKNLTLLGHRQKSNSTTLKIREYVCFLIKTLEDCLKKIPSSA